MRLLCFGGSLRKGSLTVAVMRIVAAAVEEAGHDAEVFTVSDLPRLLDPEAADATDPTIAKLGALVQWSECLLVMTPVYGGTPSGAVKNLLDTLHLFKRGEIGPLAGKRVLVGSVGGGAIAGHYEPQPTANYALEIACTNLGAWVSPRHLELSELAFDATGRLVDPYSIDAVKRAIAEILAKETVPV